MAVYPRQLRPREELNLRLGIKSSLSQLRSVVASLYIIYIANDKQSNVVYSKQQTQNGHEVIKLSEELLQSINAKYADPSFANLVESSPLFTSQLESLQVGIELFFHLGKVDFTASNLSERTGTNRYQKKIAFATNMMLIDLLLSSYSDVEVNSLLLSWLNNREANSNIEDKLCLMLNTFTEETQYKIRDTNESEIVFNQEGVYSAIFASNEVSSNDTKEPVGPFRVYKSFLSSGMHPFIIENRQTIHLKGNTNQDELKRYSEMVNTTLSLIPRRSIVTQEITVDNHIDDSETTQPPQNTDSIPEHYLPFLAALRTKPFLLLAGISGTGKSRIVRKLAQASVTEDLQTKYDPLSVANGFDRWTLHKPANFELIQVKPNWHNSLEVVGYKSNIGGAHYEFTPFVEFVAKAWKHQDVPFFLCLDEMNLAPVEQYFAEFLSAIESRSIENGEYETDPIIKPFETFDADGDTLSDRMIAHLLGKLDTQEKSNLADRFRTKGLTLPKNLFVLGTVNMDETTFSFSRKVLDRAMSIVMDDVDYESFFSGSTENDIAEMSDDLKQLLINRETEGLKAENNDADTVKEYLTNINAVLENTPFKLGYRAANEALLYVSAVNYLSDEPNTKAALDEFTLMKILSRIEGDKRSIDDLLDNLKGVINSTDFPKSNKVLGSMSETLNKKQFVSYWTK